MGDPILSKGEPCDDSTIIDVLKRRQTCHAIAHHRMYRVGSTDLKPTYNICKFRKQSWVMILGIHKKMLSEASLWFMLSEYSTQWVTLIDSPENRDSSIIQLLYSKQSGYMMK